MLWADGGRQGPSQVTHRDTAQHPNDAGDQSNPLPAVQSFHDFCPRWLISSQFCACLERARPLQDYTPHKAGVIGAIFASRWKGASWASTRSAQVENFGSKSSISDFAFHSKGVCSPNSWRITEDLPARRGRHETDVPILLPIATQGSYVLKGG